MDSKDDGGLYSGSSLSDVSESSKKKQNHQPTLPPRDDYI